MAQWQKLVLDGEKASDIQLGEELESYLVFLLMRYLEKPEMTNRIMAMEYLSSMESSGQLQQEQLRDVGDCCLLFSGFFPKIAEKRRVRISYYVNIGRTAYHHLAETCQTKLADMFHEVGDGFIHLMDVLQAIRSFENEALLSPMAAMDLWQDTRSSQALQSLQEAGISQPVSYQSKSTH